VVRPPARSTHLSFRFGIADRALNSSSNSDEIILDPFLGSGTTAIVALNHGRKFVGFEINENYCKIAADRIEQFVSEKTAPKQEVLF
jgi:adenine-specific DNA-methyltransferase